jgi:hypothetical protein
MWDRTGGRAVKIDATRSGHKGQSDPPRSGSRMIFAVGSKLRWGQRAMCCNMSAEF